MLWYRAPTPRGSVRLETMMAIRTMPLQKPSAAQPGEKPLGLRERHKHDKRQRISNAAITLFARNGYEATTLRDIATEADVALGTLSLYARDKRDLVLMIFNRVIPPLMEKGRRQTDPKAELIVNLVAFFEPFYTAYAREPTLYRIILGQIHNGPQGVHGTENDIIRAELLGYLADVILRAIAAKNCRADASPTLAARCCFYIYFAAVRVWLFQNEPDRGAGLADLRALLGDYVKGLQPGHR